jgi:hypothetical protein
VATPSIHLQFISSTVLHSGMTRTLQALSLTVLLTSFDLSNLFPHHPIISHQISPLISHPVTNNHTQLFLISSESHSNTNNLTKSWCHLLSLQARLVSSTSLLRQQQQQQQQQDEHPTAAATTKHRSKAAAAKDAPPPLPIHTQAGSLPNTPRPQPSLCHQQQHLPTPPPPLQSHKSSSLRSRAYSTPCSKWSSALLLRKTPSCPTLLINWPGTQATSYSSLPMPLHLPHLPWH